MPQLVVGGFEDHRVTDRIGRRQHFVQGAAANRRQHPDPVRGQQLRCRLVIDLFAVRMLGKPVPSIPFPHHHPSAGSVHIGPVRQRPDRGPPPVRVVGHQAERVHGFLRRRIRRHRAAVGVAGLAALTQPLRHPPRGQESGDDRFSAISHGSPQHPGVRLSGSGDRRHEHRDQGMHLRIVDSGPQGHREVVGGGVRPDIDRRSLGYPQRNRGTRVGGQHAQRCRVADDRDRTTGRQRLVRQNLRHVELLGHRGHPDHPGLGEKCLDTAFADRRAAAGQRRWRGVELFTATTGLRRASRRATLANFRGLPKDSR